MTPFEVGPYTFEALAPWRARIDPFPFGGSQQRFTLLRRLLPRRAWTQDALRRAFEESAPDRVGIELVA